MKLKIGKNVIPDIDEFLYSIRNGKIQPPDPIDYRFLGPPRFDHQKVIFWYGMVNPKFAVFCDMGTGKTGATIDITSYRLDLGDISRVLVVSPTTVLYNWGREINKFSDKTSTVLYGPLSERLQLLYETNPNFFIVNYEMLHSLETDFIKSNIDMVVFDESTRVKNPSARMSKSAYNISSRLDYNLILSGQPIANNPIDLWMQFKVLNNGATFDNRNFYSFRGRYFRKVNLGRFTKWVVNKYSLPELQKKVSSNSVRFLLEECVTMPGKAYHTHYIDLDSNQRNLYNKAVSNILVEIGKECGIDNGRIVNIGVAAAKLMKLGQICSGFMYSPNGSTIKLTNNPKINYLKELLEPIVENRKVVIWCKYTESIGVVSELLEDMNIGYVVYSGNEDPKEKQNSADSINNDPSIRVIIGQTKSGIGANFTGANYCIYFENYWDVDTREQSEHRIYRIGQDYKVVIIDLVMRNTIEEKIMKVLKEKIELADFIMNTNVNEILKLV